MERVTEKRWGESKRYMTLFRVIMSDLVVDIYNEYYAIKKH